MGGNYRQLKMTTVAVRFVAYYPVRDHAETSYQMLSN